MVIESVELVSVPNAPAWQEKVYRAHLDSGEDVDLFQSLFCTRYDSIDRLLPAVQEKVLNGDPAITYAIACDTNGYVPTHNARFTQPLTGDEKKDTAGNRTKRIFSDPVGKRCGSHEAPFLLQTYRRDTGEIMHDISAPVYVKGRHWGGFRIGYRTE